MVPQDPAGPADTGAPSGRKWRWIGLAAVIVAAVVLFGATLWVSQGGGGPLAGATGASTPTQVPTPAGVEPVAETPVPTEPAVDESEAPGEEPVPAAPAEPEPGSEPESTEPAVDAAPLPELPPVPLTEQVAPVTAMEGNRMAKSGRAGAAVHPVDAERR